MDDNTATAVIEKIERLMDISQRWLSLTEACAYAKMGRAIMLQAIHDGLISGRKRQPGGWIVDRLSIDAYNSGAVMDDHLFEKIEGRLK